MYELSQDYSILYALICRGERVAAYLDNKVTTHGEEDIITRDLCNIEKRGDWHISFFVRGLSYDTVTDFDCRNGKSEEEVFKIVCNAHNIGFIPTNK